MVNIENDFEALRFKKFDFRDGVYAMDPERKSEQRIHKRQFNVVH